MRRRRAADLTIPHYRAMVFLDEPTVGLDPNAHSSVWEHINHLRDEIGRPILLKTYLIEETDIPSCTSAMRLRLEHRQN
jgi:ABC-2 type transport system ATP-binding protein